MNAHTFRHFYGYHFTENRKLWDNHIVSRSQEQFTQAVGYSRGSVRNQIVHLKSVDEAWFSGLLGADPQSRSRPRTLTTGSSSAPTGIPLSKSGDWLRLEPRLLRAGVYERSDACRDPQRVKCNCVY